MSGLEPLLLFFALLLSFVSFCCFLILLLCFILPGHSKTDEANENLPEQIKYFDPERRITVYNVRTDMAILKIEGFMSICNSADNELIVTCKVGENEYKKNYVYLNEYTMYVVEDITGMHDDPYHYRMYFHDAPSGFETKP